MLSLPKFPTRFVTKIVCLFSLTLPLASWSGELDLALLDQVLKSAVSSGEKYGVVLNTVDYRALKNSAQFKQLVAQLNNFDLDSLKTREQTLAFYINAYNILAINVVLDHWPVNSIKDVGGLFTSVWNMPAGNIHGNMQTLNDIEHKILRPLGEPRIHMAIVCASVSCPDLRGEAYRAEKLDAQLDDQTSRFLRNPAKGLRQRAGVVEVSKIFDWFGKDFNKRGGVESFIRHYRNDLPAGVKIDASIDYDWRLNIK